MIALMSQAKKNTGNKNALLKPGEIGRVQCTVSLSGKDLIKFARHYHIDLNLEEKQLQILVKDQMRQIFYEMIEEIEED